MACMDYMDPDVHCPQRPLEGSAENMILFHIVCGISKKKKEKK